MQHKHFRLVAVALAALVVLLCIGCFAGCGEAQLTVTFDTDGGSAVAAQTVKEGSALSAPAAPTREGYEFVGWYLGDTAYDFSAPVTGNLTLTARWNILSYTVEFRDTDGEILGGLTVDWNTPAVRPKDPEKTGMDFAGWYLGDTAYDFTTPVTGDLTLTAHWTVKQLTVNFDTQGGNAVPPSTVSWNTAVSAPDDPIKDGHTFAGWYLGNTPYDFTSPVTSDLTITAHWTIWTYTVTFLDDAGNVLKTETVDWGTAATAPVPPEKGEEYLFAGWDIAFDCVKSDLTVTGRWGLKKTVTFLDEDGTLLGVRYVAEGNCASPLDDVPEKVGLQVAGWYLADSDTPFDFSTPVTADMTLSARWETKRLTVTFDTTGGSDVPAETVLWEQTATEPTAPTREGHIFLGWYLGDTVYDFSAPVTADITLTAHWQINTYTVTFLDSDGTTELARETVEWNAPVTVPASIQTLRGTALLGAWMRNGARYNLSTGVTSDIVLTAQWVDIIGSVGATEKDVYFNPGYLEVWEGLPLQLAINTKKISKGSATDIPFSYEGMSLSFFSLDPSVATVSSDGTITPLSVGETYVWAFFNHPGTVTITDTDKAGTETTRDVTVNANTFIAAIRVKIVEKPDYLKAAEADPENQKITLANEVKSNFSDFSAWPSGAYGSVVIAPWYGNTTTVFTLTVDDNIMTDFAQWIAYYQEYGVPATFFAPTSTFFETGVTWYELADAGLLAQSHSHYHLSSGTYSSGNLTSAQVWMDFYLGQQDINNAGAHTSSVIGYPCGYNDPTYSKLLYIAGRGTYGSSNAFSSINYNSIASYSGLPSSFLTSFPSIVNAANGTWYCTHYHSIGGSSATLPSYLALIQGYINEGKVWATTFMQAAQYGQERDTATVTVRSADGNMIVFSVTDRMNDILFDQALTIKIKVDGTWSAARAYQNGHEVSARVVTVGTDTYLLVDAVPDRGDVTVVRTEISNLTQTDNAISFVPTDAIGTQNGLPMTLRFAVDGSVWTNAYATQGTEKLTARVFAEQNKTYVEVTFFVNGGAVTVVPVTNQFDTLTTYTMTQVYNGEVSPDPAKSITISTVAELQMFSDYVNANHTCEGLTFLLTADLDLTGVDFEPIGWELIYEKSSANYYYHPFSGTFDGQGHTISNLTVERYMCNSALFGYTENATIQNLKVTGASILGVKRVGGIIGMMKNGTLSNCTFQGKVVNRGMDTGKNTGSYTGGLVGQLSSGVVRDCVVKADVTAYAASLYYGSGIASIYDTTLNRGNYTGGVIGNVAGISGGTVALIDNISFEGTVTGYDVDGFGGNIVGGLVGGGTSASLHNCSMTGVVRGNQNVGGLVGKCVSGGNNYQTFGIHNCIANGSVYGNDLVGGIVGYLGYTGRVAVKNCISNAKVYAASGATYAGAAIGQIETASARPGVSNVYYVASLNPSLPAYVGYQSGSVTGTYTFTPVDSLKGTLETLNTNAAALGRQPWMESGDTITPVHYPIYSVVFYDKDGEVMLSLTVPNGLGVDTIPEAPEILGFEFLGWSVTDLSNITQDTEVRAQYKEVSVWTVVFYEKDGTTEISRTEVNDGGSVTPPEAPYLLGWKFVSWSGADLNAITAHSSIVATYEETPVYTVTFVERDGTTAISTQTLNKGEDAIAPEAPEVDGYVFSGWSCSYTSVAENLTVVAQYAKLWTVRFLGVNDQLIGTVLVPDGTAATAPSAPGVVDGNRFMGWVEDFSKITADTEIHARYVAVSSDPVTVTYKHYLVSNSKYIANLETILGDEGIVFYDGTYTATFSAATLAKWGFATQSAVRGSSGGIGYGILWDTTKYMLDPGAHPFVISPSAVSSPKEGMDYLVLAIGLDSQVLAVPLIDRATNQSIIAVLIYWGANNSIDGTSKYFPLIFGALAEKFPDTDTMLVSFHASTKTDSTGKASYLSALDDTTPFAAGWSLDCLGEGSVKSTSGTATPVYTLTFAKTTYTSAVTVAPATTAGTTNVGDGMVITVEVAKKKETT